jgi:thiol-disulfide isomerase/thioredoxin
MTHARFALFPALIAIAAPALAQPIQPFSFAALHAAQASGRPVLIDVFAPWCPTCRAQAPTIDSFVKDPAFNKLTILRLDFDHQVAEKKALGVRQQSTLIAFHGGKEVGRVLGITAPGQIREFARSALR